jgi:hypothetical protein
MDSLIGARDASEPCQVKRRPCEAMCSSLRVLKLPMVSIEFWTSINEAEHGRISLEEIGLKISKFIIRRI